MKGPKKNAIMERRSNKTTIRKNPTTGDRIFPFMIDTKEKTSKKKKNKQRQNIMRKQQVQENYPKLQDSHEGYEAAFSPCAPTSGNRRSSAATSFRHLWALIGGGVPRTRRDHCRVSLVPPFCGNCGGEWHRLKI